MKPESKKHRANVAYVALHIVGMGSMIVSFHAAVANLMPGFLAGALGGVVCMGCLLLARHLVSEAHR